MELLPGVHRVPGIMNSRVYLIEDRTLAIVDAGWLWAARKVLDYIQAIGRNPEDLGLILMTHSHQDHTGSALSIMKRTGARVVAHSDDTRMISTHEVRLRHFGPLGGVSARLPFFKGALVSQRVEDGQVLPVREGLRVVHTPGHTPGSVSYLLKDVGTLFSGDTLFSDGRKISRSVPFPGYNGHDYRRSLRKLAGLNFDSLCGGHGAPLIGGASDKLRALLAVYPEPPTWGEVVRGIPRRLYQAVKVADENC